MINNRQNGRRRGRGGAQVRGPGGNGPDRGNRIDNRARGNAAQLHEKYKNLARDAQTQGDRVMTEYYLQFADHYFRVLNESRSRFDDQNQQRRARFDSDDFDEGDEGEGLEEAAEAREPREVREPREQREPRPRRDDRREAPVPAPVAAAQPQESAQPEAANEDEDGEARPRRRGRRPRRVEADDATETARIETDRLPPAFAASEDVPAADAPPGAEATPVEDAGEPAPRRRRTRRVAAAAEEGSPAAAA